MSGDRIHDQGRRPDGDLLGDDSDLELEMENGGREASRPLMASSRMNPTMGWNRPASNSWYELRSNIENNVLV